MEILVIIISVIVGVILLLYLLNIIVDNNRRRKFKHWRVGDKILLHKRNPASNILESYGKEYATLLGWTTDYLYIDCGDNLTSQVSWNVMEGNKSATWRKNYDDAKKEMGVNPGFPYDAMSQYPDDNMFIPIGKKYDGKYIDLMTEIECHVYLKMALENEDYNSAELIKKRLERLEK